MTYVWKYIEPPAWPGGAWVLCCGGEPIGEARQMRVWGSPDEQYRWLPFVRRGFRLTAGHDHPEDARSRVERECGIAPAPVEARETSIG